MNPPNWDWGVASFGSVLVTTSYVLALANNHQGVVTPGKLTRNLAMASCLLVAVNYALGAYLGFTYLDRPGFGWYCVAFVGLWIGIAIFGARLMSDSTSTGSGVENQSLVA